MLISSLRHLNSINAEYDSLFLKMHMKRYPCDFEDDLAETNNGAPIAVAFLTSSDNTISLARSFLILFSAKTILSGVSNMQPTLLGSKHP